jgi:uncharacterized peroxidase-related enzyme
MSFISRIPENEGSMASILKAYPDIALPIAMLTEYVMREEHSQLTMAERELIATYVCDLNACSYCARTHQAAAEAHGIDSTVFSALIDDIETAPVEKKLKPIFYYVKKLTLSPASMSQADADSVFSAGWNEEAFHFAVTICGMFNFYNRLLEGYGIKNTKEHYEKSGRALAKTGYMHITEGTSKQSG